MYKRVVSFSFHNIPDLAVSALGNGTVFYVFENVLFQFDLSTGVASPLLSPVQASSVLFARNHLYLIEGRDVKKYFLLPQYTGEEKYSRNGSEPSDKPESLLQNVKSYNLKSHPLRIKQNEGAIYFISDKHLEVLALNSDTLLDLHLDQPIVDITFDGPTAYVLGSSGSVYRIKDPFISRYIVFRRPLSTVPEPDDKLHSISLYGSSVILGGKKAVRKYKITESTLLMEYSLAGSGRPLYDNLVAMDELVVEMRYGPYRLLDDTVCHIGNIDKNTLIAVSPAKVYFIEIGDRVSSVIPISECCYDGGITIDIEKYYALLSTPARASFGDEFKEYEEVKEEISRFVEMEEKWRKIAQKLAKMAAEHEVRRAEHQEACKGVLERAKRFSEVAVRIRERVCSLKKRAAHLRLSGDPLSIQKKMERLEYLIDKMEPQELNEYKKKLLAQKIALQEIIEGRRLQR